MDKDEKRQRLIEAAMALLESVPQQKLNIVVLNKALFYLDLAALRDFGHTLSGATYIAMDLGPVVANYPKRLVGARAKPVRALKTLKEYRYLDQKALLLAKEIGGHFTDATSLEASSHDNVGWKIAYSDGAKRGAAPAKIDMLIAMQQLVERDPWIDAAITTEEGAVFAAADVEDGERW